MITLPPRLLSHCIKYKGAPSGPAAPIQGAPGAPPTSTSLEVTQAKIDARRQAKARTGVNQTILAGNATGMNTLAAPGQPNTLLGGG